MPLHRNIQHPPRSKPYIKLRRKIAEFNSEFSNRYSQTSRATSLPGGLRLVERDAPSKRRLSQSGEAAMASQAPVGQDLVPAIEFMKTGTVGP
jgi:hypothetical protein